MHTYHRYSFILGVGILFKWIRNLCILSVISPSAHQEFNVQIGFTHSDIVPDYVLLIKIKYSPTIQIPEIRF